MNHVNHELSPQQQTDFDNAHELANAANFAFDKRHETATELAKHLGTPDVIGAKAEFAQAHSDFELLNSAANTLMPPRSAFESVETVEAFASESVWEVMSPEQRTKAAEVRAELAAGNLKEYGVTEDSLRMVMTEEDGKKVFTLIHTGNGVDVGDPKQNYDEARSYRAVMSDKNDKLFQVEVDGKTYDARRGMTDKVYEAKVAEARERAVTLPDSQQLSAETGDDWTWTMLTGEALTADGRVPIRYVTGGQVVRNNAYPDNDRRFLRVCPAVEIQ